MTNWRAMVLILAGLLSALAGGGQVEAQPATPTELKAAYLLNFLRYTRWPAPAQADGAPLQVVVLGSGRFAEVLRALLEQPGAAGLGGIEVVLLAPGTARAEAHQALRDADAVFIEARA